MTASLDNSLYQYTVLSEPWLSHGDPETTIVTALYFTEERSFTVFKDAMHSAVYAVPTRRVLFVHRGNRA